MDSNSIINPDFSETEWNDSMKRSLHTGEEIDPHGCIFRVPKPIKDLKPKSYNPQRIAFGPYHHLQEHLHLMQNFKLGKVKSSYSSPSSYVEELVNRIRQIKGNVRAYYSERLSITDDTLSMIMVIDGLCLLELIQADESSAFFQPYGSKLLECSLWEDAVKIENQIPFFVLELLQGSRDALDRKASVFCEKVSPVESNILEVMKNPSIRPFHLLHLLYTSVCFGVEEYPTPTQTQFSGGRRNRRAAEQKRLQENSNAAPSFNFLVVPRRFVVLTTNILQLLGLSGSLQTREDNGLIPSASELSRVKVKLCASETQKGLSATEFKMEGSSTLALPTLTLNFCSDVVIQNLLAYEAIVMPDSPVFNRYIQMMGAMIRTTQDVHLLKKEKILKHDGDAYEVVKLFEGFKDCVASLQFVEENATYSCLRLLLFPHRCRYHVRCFSIYGKILCTASCARSREFF